jgi:two-component system CheB/CheR fusion protein
VRDTGIGIPAEMLPRIFDLFTQVDPAIDRSHGGLGIGLTVVRRLVEMHGGTVTAFSAGKDQGSEFTVRLPVGAGGTPKIPASSSAGALKPGLRVLVVEDNEDAAAALAALLRNVGCTTHTVHDGEAALTAAQEFGPEIVLLDIGLPNLDGFEVARRLRSQPDLQAATLIAISGYGQDHDRKKALQAGFDNHLTKPVDVQMLLKLLSHSNNGDGHAELDIRESGS